MKIGIIGGTGFYEMKGEEIEIETKHGKILAYYFEKHDREIFFISRHGREHVPAHAVNYYGNMEAMKKIGVEAIIATSTVGSMRKEIKVGSFFIPYDFIDFTKRKSTFYDDVAIHVDMTFPFCPVIRKILIEISLKIGETKEGIYAVTEGPRLETKAEINMLRNFAHAVGMTLSPEVVLAKEAGICYASLCIVSNYASGMQEKLDAQEIKKVYEEKREDVMKIIDETISKIPESRECGCKNAPESGKL